MLLKYEKKQDLNINMNFLQFQFIFSCKEENKKKSTFGAMLLFKWKEKTTLYHVSSNDNILQHSIWKKIWKLCSIEVDK